MKALPLLPGEALLWEAQPGWRAIAQSVFHVRLAALYFALVFIAGAAADRWQGLSPVKTLRAEAPVAGLGVAACAVLLALAWLTARSTAYALTDRRVVLRFGVALPVTVSLPLRTVGAVAVRVHADHSGDIPLALRSGEHVAFVKLWPLVRPWRLRRAQPMLRAVPQAGAVAALLSRTVAGAQRDAERGPDSSKEDRASKHGGEARGLAYANTAATNRATSSSVL